MNIVPIGNDRGMALWHRIGHGFLAAVGVPAAFLTGVFMDGNVRISVLHGLRGRDPADLVDLGRPEGASVTYRHALGAGVRCLRRADAGAAAVVACKDAGVGPQVTVDQRKPGLP